MITHLDIVLFVDVSSRKALALAVALRVVSRTDDATQTPGLRVTQRTCSIADLTCIREPSGSYLLPCVKDTYNVSLHDSLVVKELVVEDLKFVITSTHRRDLCTKPASR